MISPFIVECIEEMMEKTKRKKARTKNDESEGQREVLTDLECIGNALLASSGYEMHGSFACTFYSERISEIIARLSQKYYFYLVIT